MTDRNKIFIRDSERAFDLKNRAIPDTNRSMYMEVYRQGAKRASPFPGAGEYVFDIKTDALVHLADSLEDDENKITARGKFATKSFNQNRITINH